jgi:hypothetical protein
MKTALTKEELENIASEALNALCLSVQEAIGQTDGGVAGLYFSGDHLINEIINDYIRTEIMFGSKIEETAK